MWTCENSSFEHYWATYFYYMTLYTKLYVKSYTTTISVAIVCINLIWGATFSNLALSSNHSSYVLKGQKTVVYQACMIHSVCQAMDQACGLNTQWALPLSFIRLQSAEPPSVCLQNDAPLQLLLIIYSHYIWQQDNLRGC